MTTTSRLLILAASAALAMGCAKEDEAAKQAAEAAATPAVVLSAPTENDLEAWKAYMIQEVKPYIDKRYRRPYMYFIPKVDAEGEDMEEQLRQYNAQLEAAQGAIARGILAGSMLAFSGPAPEGVADVIEQSFRLAGPKSLNGVRVVVISDPSVKERIETAIAPSEAEFVWVDME